MTGSSVKALAFALIALLMSSLPIGAGLWARPARTLKMRTDGSLGGLRIKGCSPPRSDFGEFPAPRLRPPLSPGDWVINETEVHCDEVIVLTGNLIVLPGGNLTLINCTLLVNCTYGGQWRVEVLGGGVMNVLAGSNITAYDPRYGFLFYVYGKLLMRDSFLSECGCFGHPSPWFETWGARLENTTIARCFTGVYCYTASNVVISGCRILNCSYGVISLASTRLTIEDCTFVRSGVLLEGGELAHFASHTIENNVVNGKPLYYVVNATGYEVPSDAGEVIVVNCKDISVNGANLSRVPVGLEIMFSESVRVEGCAIDDGPGYGVFCERSSGVSIRNCTIKNHFEEGVHCHNSSDVVISDCTIVGNNYGVECYASSGVVISNCTICGNEEGVEFSDSSNVAVLNCVVYDQSSSGICCYGSRDVQVHYCDIFSNVFAGVTNYDEQFAVNATYCWWGRERPKYDEDVYGKVIYDPWLTRPVMVSLPSVRIISPTNGTAVAGDSITVVWNVTPGSFAISKVQIRLDQEEWIDVTKRTNYTFTGLSKGGHVVVVKAVDEKGLTGRCFVSFKVRSKAKPEPGILLIWYLGGVAVVIAAALGVALALKIRRGERAVSTLGPPQP